MTMWNKNDRGQYIRTADYPPYDYYEAVAEDMRQYIEENKPELPEVDDYRGWEELKQQLNDECWVADSVTGNASGSYTFSSWLAEEYLVHNMNLLAEAACEFGDNAADWLRRGAEYCDVTIRCYLLGQAIEEVVDEMREEAEEMEGIEND